MFTQIGVKPLKQFFWKRDRVTASNFLSLVEQREPSLGYSPTFIIENVDSKCLRWVRLEHLSAQSFPTMLYFGLDGLLYVIIHD